MQFQSNLAKYSFRISSLLIKEGRKILKRFKSKENAWQDAIIVSSFLRKDG